MLQSLSAFIIALLLAVGLTRNARRSLSWLTSRERKVGKEKIHRLFPKPRRPLGGGAAIVLSATIGIFAAPILFGASFNPLAYWIFPLIWVYAVIGMVDDVKKAGGSGLGDRTKFFLQLVVALAFGFLLWRFRGYSSIEFPLSSKSFELGLLYIPFAALVLVATANAVNLSDGIDGLAGGATVIALLGLAALSGLESTREPITQLCWPLIGAVLGFLVYNLPPARLLMGDTGALALGAALGGLAIFSGNEFWLILLGAPFVVNAASVLVQMGAVRGLWRIVRPLRYRTTEPARPFLCTPLHHHFQWLGWDDWRVLGLFWGLGAVMCLWTLLTQKSGVFWVLGLLVEAVFLLGAGIQKLLSGNYFLGLLAREGERSRLALFRGLPVTLLGLPLYRTHYETSITEDMLTGATAESMLWRLITEVEAHVVLGKIYNDQKLLGEALGEWEQVPTRNLLLRPSVVLKLARIYYGQDRLFEAIKLWEQLPASRLQDMPSLREVVRSAKRRLADLASRSHRQGMRMLQSAERTGEAAERIERYLLAARQFNRDLLSLLLYERDKLKGKSDDPQGVRARRELLRQTQHLVLARLRESDQALGQLARAVPEPALEPASAPALADVTERAARELGLSRTDLIQMIAGAGQGQPIVSRVAVNPKASRNAIFRLSLAWPDSGASSVIAKRYAEDRISFFSACYRRERGVLELLHSYRCQVPRVYGGALVSDQAILIMQDLGDETLSERMEGSDLAIREQWLRSAIRALVALQASTHEHIRELTEEVRKIDKESLGDDYYLNALRIALNRIASLIGKTITDGDWQRISEQAAPLVDFLSNRPSAFIHFEFTPHHLLVTEAGLYSFDFEQATIGPLEFDLAALLSQPESDLGPDGWQQLLRYYRSTAAEAGLPAMAELERATAFAAAFKCLVYGGAAANFLEKFGGEHHVQRLRYYLDRATSLLMDWHTLRPLGNLLASPFRAAREISESKSQNNVSYAPMPPRAV